MQSVQTSVIFAEYSPKPLREEFSASIDAFGRAFGINGWALRVIPTMAITVSRTPVLVCHPSCEVTHVSWACDSSPLPSRAVTAAFLAVWLRKVIGFGWVLSPTWLAANFGLQSVYQKHKGRLLLLPVVVPRLGGRKHE